MKVSLVAVMFALTLIGCGKGQTGDQGSTGSPGTPAPTPSSFQGFYVFPDAGYMEIVQDTGSLSDVTQIRLVVKNTDNTSALIPIGAVSNLPVQNDKLYYLTNFTYVALIHNVKTDVGNTALVGSLFTYITMSKSNGILTVRVQVSNGLAVVFDHSVSSL